MSEHEPPQEIVFRSPQEIVFRVGARRAVTLSRSDANEIDGRAVERSIQALELHSAIGAGMRTGELAIDDNQVRHELVLILEAIAEEHELTNGQADLLEVAGPPLTVQNP